MNASTWVLPAFRLFALCIPLGFGLSIAFVSLHKPFQSATVTASTALGVALLTAFSVVASPLGGEILVAPAASLSSMESLSRLVRLDPLTCVLLLLVCFISLIIVRYSRTYLHGDAGQVRYARSLLATIAAVTTLVIANNLLIIALSWMAASIALHQLLTFYRERPEALVAAHKKFILSRIADACMLGAIALIAQTVGSLNLDAVNTWASEHAGMPRSMQIATLLLALTVTLKSAQLPFHGWLIQVMEAPTPVSALLHAGIVNIGGFVLIRMAPLMAQAPIAQAFLVMIGTVTAVIAALVMTTRVSIKVALAWSTCAQMGFMLIECGLGLWHLALLHLVAHSLYKAHAFLNAGATVDAFRIQSMARPPQPTSLAAAVGSASLVFASIAVGAVASNVLLGNAFVRHHSLVPLIIIFGLSLSPLVLRARSGSTRARLTIALRCSFVTMLYGAGHAAFARIFQFQTSEPSQPAWIFTLAGFALLFVLQLALECRPNGRLTRALQPLLFAGFYLDEYFTRIMFRRWPPRLRYSGLSVKTLCVVQVSEAK
jgi:NAD(P)H-quinone oxidoreductase subunit 5